MWKEFKEFALRGNVWDMAVGIIIGGAFTPIAKSLVDDVLMPPIGMLLGNVDFTNLYLVLRSGDPPAPYASLDAAREAGAVVVAYGAFVNTIVTFVVVAFAVFLLIRSLNAMRRKDEAAGAEESVSRRCPFCALNVPVEAIRCPNCTSEIGAYDEAA